MEQGLNSRIDRLQQLNARLRYRLEVAETYIPPLNELIERLASLSLMNGLLVLGEVVCLRAYNAEADHDESALVYQAAAAVPEGIGIIVWDEEEYLEAESTNANMAQRARSKLLGYAFCSPGLKALLIDQTPFLLEILFNRIRFTGPLVSNGPLANGTDTCPS